MQWVIRKINIFLGIKMKGRNIIPENCLISLWVMGNFENKHKTKQKPEKMRSMLVKNNVVQNI